MRIYRNVLGLPHPGYKHPRERPTAEQKRATDEYVERLREAAADDERYGPAVRPMETYGAGSASRCTCPDDATWPWDCLDCPEHGEAADKEAAAEAKAEHDAEYAWLRAAENPWPPDPPDDYSF